MTLKDGLIGALGGGAFGFVLAWITTDLLGMSWPWWASLLSGAVFGFAYVLTRPSSPRATGEVFHPKHDGDIPW